MQGVYEGVKQGDMPLAVQCFGEALALLLQRHGAVPVIMGCTEIPLALPQASQAGGAEWWTRLDTGLRAGAGRLRTLAAREGQSPIKDELQSLAVQQIGIEGITARSVDGCTVSAHLLMVVCRHVGDFRASRISGVHGGPCR